MRRNITIGVDPDEYMRLQGAAAMCGMPLATYLKWLLRGGAAHDSIAQNEIVQNLGLLIRRMDGVGSTLQQLARAVQGRASPSLPEPEVAAVDVPEYDPERRFASRELIEKELKNRGIPSSTIRQLFIVLDEVDAVQRNEADACRM
jgi:hypothetical protein